MEYWDIIKKSINNEASAEEKAALESWLKEDAANVQLLEDAKATWNMLGETTNTSVNFNANSAWNAVQEKINKENNVVSLTSANNIKWIYRMAAVLVLSLFSTWYFLNRNSSPEELVAQSNNERLRVTLPDGSKVWLNSNSKLTYPKQFNSNTRAVKLEGEAFFDVTKNPEQPFVISNADFEVKVLGTSFNVLAYSKLSDVVVTVVTGTVSFQSNSGESVLLTKDETGTLNKRNKKVNEIINNDTNFMAWQNGKIEFDNTSIKSVCTTIKDYFGIDVIVENQNVYNCKFTGSFNNPTLQEVLTVLENTLNIKTKINQSSITISGDGC